MHCPRIPRRPHPVKQKGYRTQAILKTERENSGVVDPDSVGQLNQGSQKIRNKCWILESFIKV